MSSALDRFAVSISRFDRFCRKPGLTAARTHSNGFAPNDALPPETRVVSEHPKWKDWPAYCLRDPDNSRCDVEARCREETKWPSTEASTLVSKTDDIKRIKRVHAPARRCMMILTREKVRPGKSEKRVRGSVSHFSQTRATSPPTIQSVSHGLTLPWRHILRRLAPHKRRSSPQ